MIAIRRRKSAHCFKVVGGFIKEIKCSARDARNIKRVHVNTESFSHQLSDDCAKPSITPFTRCCKQKVGSVFWTKSAKAITLNYSDWLVYDIVYKGEKETLYAGIHIYLLCFILRDVKYLGYKIGVFMWHFFVVENIEWCLMFLDFMVWLSVCLPDFYLWLHLPVDTID